MNQAPAGKPATLGAAIANFRRRLHRPHFALPCSQEDLAFAIGTDQAYISRIESNRRHPQYSTLTRISDALRLSRSERAYVLSLAGFLDIAPLPDEKEAARVLSVLGPLVESLPYPATVGDEGERIWYYNRLAIALLGPVLGVVDQQTFREVVRAKRYLGLVSPSDVYERWKTYWQNLDSLQTRLVAILLGAYRIRQQDPDLNVVLDAVRKNRGLRQHWERIERGEVHIPFLEHGAYVLRHPKLGRIYLSAWRTHFAEDERFIVTHHTPSDPATSRICARLAREFQTTKMDSPHATD